MSNGYMTEYKQAQGITGENSYTSNSENPTSDAGVDSNVVTNHDKSNATSPDHLSTSGSAEQDNPDYSADDLIVQPTGISHQEQNRDGAVEDPVSSPSGSAEPIEQTVSQFKELEAQLKTLTEELMTVKSDLIEIPQQTLALTNQLTNLLQKEALLKQYENTLEHQISEVELKKESLKEKLRTYAILLKTILQEQ